jgi:hypothetical protein
LQPLEQRIVRVIVCLLCHSHLIISQ